MSKIQKQYCFTHPGGEDIYLFTLNNRKGTKLSITNYGAIITAIKIKQPDESYTNIVLGFDKVEDYFSPTYLDGYPYFGSAIGRYANRIKNGEFSIDGNKYTVTKNKGTDHLLGGINGFDKKVWKFISLTELPHPALTLQYISPAGEEGYPGELTITLKFELTDEDECSYEYRAYCDQPTVVNLTHHSYFNLDTQKNKIDKHLVKIQSSAILEQDNNWVVTGKLLPVKDTIYDFGEFRKIDANWNFEDGYDQTFVADQNNNGLPQAEAYSVQSGICLQVFTTEPVVHFYTGKWIPVLNHGNEYGPFAGFCFETQKHPNAINIAHFPNTILRPGEIYNTKTIYRITRLVEK